MNEPTSQASHVINAEIKDNDFVIKGDFHQADARFFESPSRGRQCTAIAAASIVMSAITPPSTCTSEIVNEVLNVGDKLYSKSIKDRGAVSSQEKNSQFLTAEEVSRTVSIFQQRYKLNVDGIAYGTLYENSDGFPTLEELLIYCHTEKKSGILTCHDMSISILAGDAGLGIFDSHGRGPDGKLNDDGVAFYLSKPSVDDLVKILHLNLANSNDKRIDHNQYQFTLIEPLFESNERTENSAGAKLATTSGTEFSHKKVNLATTSGTEFIHQKAELSEESNIFANIDWIFEQLHKVYDEHKERCKFKNMFISKKSI